METERAVAELERFLADRGDQLLRTEVGYCGATGVLALGLTVLYRRGAPAR